MTTQEIKDYATVHYFAPDGLMALDADGFRPPYPGGSVSTVTCDNGILFAVQFYLLCKAKGLFDVTDMRAFNRAALLLENPGATGYFNRNPGRNADTEAPDNYSALVTGGLLSGYDVATRICAAGDRNGYIFDNTAPDALTINEWRQGADIACYQFGASRRPQLWNVAWLCASIVANAAQDIDTKASEWLCEWVRLKGLDLSYVETTLRAQINNAKNAWLDQLKIKTNGRGIQVLFEKYFPPGHPNVLMAQGVFY